MMNPAYKSLWLAALRSGDYRQGKEFLHRADGSRCCLGVLCKVAEILHDDGPNRSYDADNEPVSVFDYDGDPQNLTGCLLDEFGLSEDEATELTEMNDGRGDEVGARSFAEIADWIEENL